MMNATEIMTLFTPQSSEYEEFGDFSTTSDYNDEILQNEICEKSGVREFRRYYEPALYWMIVILGAIGNSLVVWIYANFKNRLKAMTDVYLLNLALADLFFLCTLPFWAADSIYGWSFGLALCKIVSGIYKINFFSSMFLLTCISVDRYIVIVQTTKAQNSKRIRLLYSKLICVIVWLLAALMSIPEFLFSRSKDNGTNSFCTMVYWNNEHNRTKILVLALQICMGFCIPLVVMIFCYTNIIRTLLKTRNFQKHKALRVILAVVAVFVLSQLPYNGMLVLEVTQAANTTITNCEDSRRFDIATQVMKSIAYMHSCLNPFLYAFVGVRFRKDVIRIFQNLGSLPNLKNSKLLGNPHRSSVMSDTDTTNALSL